MTSILTTKQEDALNLETTRELRNKWRAGLKDDTIDWSDVVGAGLFDSVLNDCDTLEDEVDALRRFLVIDALDWSNLVSTGTPDRMQENKPGESVFIVVADWVVDYHLHGTDLIKAFISRDEAEQFATQSQKMYDEFRVFSKAHGNTLTIRKAAQDKYGFVIDFFSDDESLFRDREYHVERVAFGGPKDGGP